MAGGVGGWRIEVTNLRQLFNALELVDKRAVDVIKKNIRAKGNEVKKSAQVLTPNNPLRSWGPWRFSRDGRDLGWDTARVVAGFSVKQNNFKKRGVARGIGYDVLQRNAAGAIFEVLGDGSRIGETKFDWQGEGFVMRIKNRYPATRGPRTLVQAYYRNMTPDFRESIKEQIIAEARKAGLV
jgi:hypothetical protein